MYTDHQVEYQARSGEWHTIVGLSWAGASRYFERIGGAQQKKIICHVRDSENARVISSEIIEAWVQDGPIAWGNEWRGRWTSPDHVTPVIAA
jgi:hypothetical protein